jgi:CheY-like chemotaxis protein
LNFKRLILIVEDDIDVLQSLADVLDAEGFDTARACNGRQAIDYLRAGHCPQLILLDMMMPVMNGWEFRQEQLRIAGAADIPVVVLTADGEPRRKATALHAHGHLAKPVGVDKLLQEIDRVCSSVRRQAEGGAAAER